MHAVYEYSSLTYIWLCIEGKNLQTKSQKISAATINVMVMSLDKNMHPYTVIMMTHIYIYIYMICAILLYM